MGDLRLGESWTFTQRVRNEGWYRAALLALAGVRTIPRGALPALGRTLGVLAWSSLPAWRQAAADRLEAAFDAPPVTPIEVFRGLGEDLADAVRLLDPKEPVEATLKLADDVEPLLREALADSKGVVFATAHLGPMERMAALVASRGFQVATLARESYDPRFTALYEELRAKRSVRSLYRAQPGTERAIVRALREGVLVGFPMDLPGRGMACAACRFLGIEQLLPVGPARIALRTGAAFVVGTPACSDSGEMVVTAERVEVGPGLDAEALTQAVALVLERRIKALPAHWPWMSAPSPGSVRSGAHP